jgi:hypothetical protein
LGSIAQTQAVNTQSQPEMCEHMIHIAQPLPSPLKRWRDLCALPIAAGQSAHAAQQTLFRPPNEEDCAIRLNPPGPALPVGFGKLGRFDRKALSRQPTLTRIGNWAQAA